MKKVLLFAMLLALAACNHLEPKLNEPSSIWFDTPIRKSELLVYVQPSSRQHQPMRALLYPMWIKQPYPDRLDLGRSFARVFHNAWTEEQLFPAQVLGEDLVYRNADKAVAEGRRRGADVVIVLSTPYFYSGHTVDDTSVTVDMQMYETTGGQLLYSMQQAARIEYKARQDWIAFAVEHRMPADPLTGCLWSIAKDMAVPLKSWLPPYNPRDLGFASTRSEIIGGLTGEGGSTSANAYSGGAFNGAADVIATGGAVYLRVEFDVDKDVIRPEYYPQLDELGQALTSSALAGRRIMLGGHTDSDASAEYNLDLSRRRAEAVKSYLVRHYGMDPGLLSTRGYGEERPIMPNDSAANKQLNRRVEVRLLD
ncbi:MAG: OmpA family protein [Desulfovibrionaceae bacterium]